MAVGTKKQNTNSGPNPPEISQEISQEKVPEEYQYDDSMDMHPQASSGHELNSTDYLASWDEPVHVTRRNDTGHSSPLTQPDHQQTE